MSFSNASQSSSSPRAKCDQVIFEAMAKAAEIIVHSRSPSPHSSNTSARFNLCVPEIAELRQSLQHHRQALHLPLRLEVRSKNQQLVERWSLEYTLQQTQPIYGDPIVQLRHVCKKIVIWLRTLYCWTRMLPSFCLRGQDLFYRLEVCEGQETDVPYFSYTKSPGVATPYGVLQYRVWYASQITKPITKPIPIAFSSHKISSSSPILVHAKSLPITRDINIHPNHKLDDDASSNNQQPGSFDRCRQLQRAHSNTENHRTRSGDGLERSLSLERSSHSASISRRSALHDPPTYAYNDTPSHTNSNGVTPDTPVPATLSSSPAMYSCSTPPTVPPTPPLSSTPPTMGFLLPPAGLKRPSSINMATTPPFSGLPHELAAAANQQQEEKRSNSKKESELPPTSSLDLLHSSPFHKSANGLMSSAFSSFNGGNESEWLRNSLIPVDQCKQNNNVEDMPFAVDDEDDGAVSMGDIRFAAKADAPHLSLFDVNKSHEDDLQSLAKQLQEFQAFGATLTS